MSAVMSTLESILPYAIRLSQSAGNANAASNFLVRLQLIHDVEVLEQLASRFSLDPDVSYYVWKRLAALRPADPVFLVKAAGVFYSMGFDDEASAQLDEAIAIDSSFVPAWELKAALCDDKIKRRAILERILELDPGNRMAVDSLIMMGRPKS